MKYFKSAFLFIVLMTFSCQNKNALSKTVYETNTLRIEQVSENVYLHISFLKVNSYGGIPCNGMLFISNQEALVFDTPASNEVSKELIQWIEHNRNSQIKGLVINHSHNDCLGGIEAFHDREVPSYANNLTLELAKKDGLMTPNNGFNGGLELTVGGKKVINKYFGEGHSKDNIVSYIPSEEVLFGGCMIKTLKAGKGNVTSANTLEWPKTVSKVKSAYPNVKVVIPGHGKIGGTDLFDYTIELFQE